MKRLSSDQDAFSRGCREAIELLSNRPLSRPIIMRKFGCSSATAKRDLVRLELEFPQLLNTNGIRWLPA